MAELQQEAAEEDAVKSPLTDSEKQEIRMILVGKTGAEKSRTGNAILRKTAFKSSLSSSSVTPQCEKETGEFGDKLLSVVDSPGVFDTRTSQEEVKMKIARSIWFVDPGPHVFLVVLHPGRFTEEEQKTVKILLEVLGEEAAAYMMVVFTHGDDLEEERVSVEESIKDNPALKAFISQCGGGYVVFNNKVKEPDQIRELLKKIDDMVVKNGGSCFNSESLEEARRAIAIAQLLRENVDVKLEALKLVERDNLLLQGFRSSTSILIAGAGTGAAVGSLLGPVGSLVGGTVGAICAAAVVVKREVCSIQ